VVRQASSSKDALQIIKTSRPNVALLDFNLDGETSASVAAELKASEISFVYLTGNEAAVLHDPIAPRSRIIRKPFRSEDVLGIVQAELR